MLPVGDVVGELRLVAAVGQATLVEVGSRDGQTREHRPLKLRTERIEPRVTLRERLVIEAQTVAGDEGSRPSRRKPLLKLRAKDVRRHPLLLQEAQPGLSLIIESQKLIGHIAIAQQQRRLRAPGMLYLNAVGAVVEDGIVCEEKPMGFERQVGLLPAGGKGADQLDGGFEDEIGGTIRIDHGGLAGIFGQRQPSSRGELEYIVCVENFLLGDGRPIAREGLKRDEGPKQQAEPSGSRPFAPEALVAQSPHPTSH